MLVKLINSAKIEPCPRWGHSEADGRCHSNLPKFYESHTALAAADGYYPLTETPQPTVPEGYTVIPSYALVDGSVVRSWTQAALPEESDPITDIELALAELTEIVLGGGA